MPHLALLVLLAAAPDAARDEPLVDASTIVEGLALDIRYASEKNLVGRKLYDEPVCLLRQSVAERLARAQRRLAKKGLRLKAFDCYRPLAVQAALWNAVPQRGLVAPPSGGSNHNRGAAVDCSLVRSDGSPVEMPTDYDSFTPAAHARSELPSAEAKRNRQLLRESMLAEGFTPLRLEWWHFDAPDPLSHGLLDLPVRGATARPGKR